MNNLRTNIGVWMHGDDSQMMIMMMHFGSGGFCLFLADKRSTVSL